MEQRFIFLGNEFPHYRTNCYAKNGVLYNIMQKKRECEKMN